MATEPPFLPHSGCHAGPAWSASLFFFLLVPRRSSSREAAVTPVSPSPPSLFLSRNTTWWRRRAAEPGRICTAHRRLPRPRQREPRGRRGRDHAAASPSPSGQGCDDFTFAASPPDVSHRTTFPFRPFPSSTDKLFGLRAAADCLPT